MTRRRVLCGLLVISAVLACFGGWLWMASGPRVSLLRFERVKEGMSHAEVNGIVGGPPGDYFSDGRVNKFDHDDGHQSWWFGDDAALIVDFNDSGTVANALILEYPSVRPTFTERIRRWLGL
jgi:hypothetical protein